MVDPYKVTNYERTPAELEEFALFCVAVAGKSAVSTARALDRYLKTIGAHTSDKPSAEFLRVNWVANGPFAAIRWHWPGLKRLALDLRDCGFGCYKARAKSFEALAFSGIDLRTCSTTDLQALPGWGPKTARFFLLHTRRGFRGAALDTHVLKFLRDSGTPNVPKSTPPAGPAYNRLESAFLGLVPPWSTLADFDLEVWKRYAKPEPKA